MSSPVTNYFPASDNGIVGTSRIPNRKRPAGKRTVLVVENHEEVRDIVGSMVADQGWHPLKAATVSEALTCLDREIVDAIVSDWELDDGDGDQILKKAASGKIRIPTVMISSYASPELIAQARAAGAVDMLAKPFRVEELTDLLTRELSASD